MAFKPSTTHPPPVSSSLSCGGGSAKPNSIKKSETMKLGRLRTFRFTHLLPRWSAILLREHTSATEPPWRGCRGRKKGSVETCGEPQDRRLSRP